MVTPFELSVMIDVHNRKKESHYEEIVTQSYLSAYYNRVKKMPSLKEVLNKKPTKNGDKGDSALDEIKRINAALGGHVY
jgi:hypothetical protein